MLAVRGTRTGPASFEVIGGTRAAVVQTVRQGVARGEFQLMDGGLHPMADGRVYARVRRLRPAAPAWRRPVAVGSLVLAVLGLLAYVAWLLVSALVAIAVPLMVATVMLVAVQVIRSVAGGGSVEVLQRVTVRR